MKYIDLVPTYTWLILANAKTKSHTPAMNNSYFPFPIFFNYTAGTSLLSIDESSDDSSSEEDEESSSSS